MRELAKSQSYNNSLAKFKGLVRFVKISSVANEKLRDLCGKVVMKECPTGWNAVLLLMIERLLVILSSLEDVLKHVNQDSLTNTAWDTLSDLQRVLKSVQRTDEQFAD
jgi:hypothetical protein